MTKKRFSLDSNVYDYLVAEPSRFETIKQAIAQDLVEFVSTHIEEDELELIPDQAKSDAIASVPRTPARTYGVVLGTSRLGMARLAPAEPIEAVRNGSVRKTNDALIASTALFEGTVLVTNDRRLRNFAQRQGTEVWTAKELVDYLEQERADRQD